MNNEIKEILEDMNLVANYNKVPIYYTQKQIKTLLDYITNLQEELEKYKRYVDETFLYSYEELQDKVINLQEKYNDLLEIHKIENNDIQELLERKEKAINYYLKELSKNGSMADEPVKMFNILEGNI